MLLIFQLSYKKSTLNIERPISTISFFWEFEPDILGTLCAMVFSNSKFYKERMSNTMYG